MVDNKHPFEGLDRQEQIDALIDYIDGLRDLVFDLQQRVEYFEKQTELTPNEILQRKEVWSKKEVCDYFSISSKTFERWGSSSEIRVVKIGGKDYCRLIDLKDRFRYVWFLRGLFINLRFINN